MEDFPLKSCVILGYTDTAAAGSRALLGYDEDQYAVHQFSLKCYREVTPAARCETSSNSQITGLICNHKIKDVSFIILNVVFPTKKKHSVANELMNLISQRNIREFIVLSAFPNGFNSTYMTLKIPDMNHESTKLCCSDPFLNSLLQFCMTESFATFVIAVDGRKATKDSSPNSMDGSLQCIKVLHKYLKEEMGLELNMTKSCSWIYQGDTIDDETTLLMYV